MKFQGCDMNNKARKTYFFVKANAEVDTEQFREYPFCASGNECNRHFQNKRVKTGTKKSLCRSS